MFSLYALDGDRGPPSTVIRAPQMATGLRDRTVMAQTRVPLYRKAPGDARAREIISLLRLELEEWSPAFIELLGPDEEDWLWVVFDPRLKMPEALELTDLALTTVADDWKSHFDPPRSLSRAKPPSS